MHDSPLESLPSLDLLEGLAELSSPELRAGACDALARQLGGTMLLLFAADPDIGVLLPAPGLPQVLQGASAWRQFLQACVRYGCYLGEVPGPDGELAQAEGIAADETVAVLMSPRAPGAGLQILLPLLPLVGSLLKAERRIDADSIRVRQAVEVAERSKILTRAMQEMREQLVGALGDARTAREEATHRAAHAESLATELQAQTDQLQEQAMELEMVNQELAERTLEAEMAGAVADEANRAKSQFLANMSHELRTPINAVIGYADLLTLGIAGPITEGQLAQLRRISASSRHLLGLINDVLDLAKVEAGQMTVSYDQESLRDVVQEAKDLLDLQAEAREITIKLNLSDEELHYVGDRDRVRQILVNLLSNAVKFTQARGEITIRSSLVSQPADGAELAGAGPWTLVEVEDTGIGIAPEELGSVFRPFIQAEKGHTRSRDGTGLGLTISRQLARLMGGDLTARSTLGVGSCFSVWLPAVPGKVGEIDHAIAVGPQISHRFASTPTEAGAILLHRTPDILAAFTRRARAELPSSAIAGMTEAEILGRVPVIVADVAAGLANNLAILDGEAGAISLIAAEQHGADRQRRGWSEAAARWEFEILRQEFLSAIGLGPVDLEQPITEDVPSRLAKMVNALCAASLKGRGTPG